MTKLRASLLTLPLFALLLGGCPIYGPEHEGRPGPCVGSECGGCFDATDCRAGEICTDAGLCRPAPSSCRTHGDCAVGSYCDETCTPSSTCGTDAECSDGFLCDYRGTCVPPVAGACRDTADCTGEDVCVEGFCRPRTDICQFNYQCGAGRACVDNRCTAICTEDSVCAAGETCVDRFCRPTPECVTSANCDAGEHCVDGRCFTDCADGTACGTSNACNDDSFCRPDFGPRAFCPATPCAAGHVCIDGVCRTPCPTGTNEECRRFDSQLPICASDDLCYSTSETMPECATAADCPDDESCIDAICR